jgi:hypothetical protein
MQEKMLAAQKLQGADVDDDDDGDGDATSRNTWTARQHY